MLDKNSKLSRHVVKKIIRHFVVDINATQCSKLLWLNRNTINRYYMNFRLLIYDHQAKEFEEKIWGTVEFDESYFWGRRKKGVHGKLKRWRGTLKQPVFGIYERSWKVYTEIISDCTKKTLQAIIRGKVAKEAIVNTDWWRWYDWLVDVGYNKHFRVNHSKNEFSKWNWVHVNWIEAYRSFCKRRLAKFNGVKSYFALHLKESERRYLKSDIVMEKELYSMVNNNKKKKKKEKIISS
jgi:transposase-like protein